MGLRTKVHPWRRVVANEGTVTRYWQAVGPRLTTGQQMRQLRLECGHLAERPVTPNRPEPKRVRCDDCPKVTA